MFTAGTLHFPLPRFIAADGVGAGLWAVLQTAIGYFGGRALDDTLTALVASLGVAVALGAVVHGLDRLVRRRRA
jgi:membrane-associated protein